MDNFEKQCKEMQNLSIAEIVKASDYINLLAAFVPENNEVLDNLSDIQEPLLKVIKNCKTDKKCPHCRGTLYFSDIPQYEYVCPECDENFFECEIS